ncbi:SCO2521 family protein [Streptomyces sp. NPDC029041]|uniref:SCO2521 family protein n=1 Tax=Streptomyces sp. NPDC029041 TaxID=3155727 RepID=UPI0033D83B75
MTRPTSSRPHPSLFMVGEVCTGLLMNRAALPASVAAELLNVAAGERVRSHERPVRRSVSPDLLHGLDRSLEPGAGGPLRGTGTLRVRGRVVGGRVVQSSTRAVVRAGNGRRMHWGHHLTQPGVVEVNGRGDRADLARSFAESDAFGTLDMNAANTSLLVRLQASRLLNQRPPLRTRRTRLRWSAIVDHGSPGFQGAFALIDDRVRAFRLVIPPSADASPERLSTLCEDLAFHDWLLTTVTSAAERTGTDRGETSAAEKLAPLILELAHLWMPGAVVTAGLQEVWDRLEAHAGFTRQWSVCVGRIRDHLALHP